MKIEVREDKVIIDGYVNAVDRFSKVLKDKKGKFIEKILPKVFERALEKNDSIKVLLNHNYEKELANTKDGTAKLYEDNVGLRAIVEITDSEVIEKAKKKKLRGWSFGFICKKLDSYVNSDGLEERTVRDIELHEISIIDDRKIPAYIGTSIEMRDGEVEEIEFRNGELETDSFSNEKDSKNNSVLTASQKREILSATYRDTYPNGWLEDYDDKFVYGTTSEKSTLYKIPYEISNGSVVIDTTSPIKVIRGGYKEVRTKSESNQLNNRVEKIDYSKYEERLRKIKEEN